MQKRHSYNKEDFKWVQWTARDIERITKEIILEKKDRYKKIKKISKDNRTFENTVVAIEQSDYGISDKSRQIELLRNVSPKASVRTTASKAQEILNKAFVEIEYDKDIYNAFKEYEEKKEKIKELGSKKLFEDMVKGYKRMGFHLSDKIQNRLKQNFKELGKLSIKFDKNINDWNDYILVTLEELDGLPQLYIDNLTKDSSGKYKVSLEYPELFPFLAGAHNVSRRKELYDKSLKKGGLQNVSILQKMISIRQKNAKLLGYKTHVDFNTEMRTAKSAKNVENFIKNLIKKTEKETRKDFKMLEDFKKNDSKKGKFKLQYYDIAYYAKKLEKELYDVDSDLVREYFSFQKVKHGTLSIYSKLFSVSFKRIKNISLWNKDVELYKIEDKNGNLLSYFYLDLYPRKGKYGHAAVFDLVSGRVENKKYIPPTACMVTNFPKSSKKTPSLLSHGEVETFFHEFGHVMHHTLTNAQYESQSGFHAAWDFVEAPSQMFENWVWDEKMLKILSSHYKTKKPLPKKLIKSMIKSKKHLVAYSTMGQLVLTLLDFTLHSKKVASMNKLYRDLMDKYIGIQIPKNNLKCASFGHLAHGYDAGYYGYIWSLVFAQDMFSRFEKEGLLNKKTGTDYRKWILEKGSSMDELKLVESFLGRKSNNKAFLKSLNIKV